MKHNGGLSIIITVDGREIKRKFDPSFKRTIFGKGLRALQARKAEVRSAFPGMEGIIDKILADNLDVFLKPQDMPWYLDLIALRVVGKKRPHRIYVKGCKEYSFFDVSISNTGSKRRKLLLPPFFYMTPLPTAAEESELVRGLADTLLFLSPVLKEVLDGSNSTKLKDYIRDAIDWFAIELSLKRDDKLTRGKAPGPRQFGLDVRATVDWGSSPVMKGKKSIRVYGPLGKPKDIIVSSKNVRDAIGELSKAWHNPTAGSILLSAWTGSGKDVLQDILTYALSVYDVTTVPLSSPHLGSSEKPLEGIFEEMRTLGFFKKLSSRPIRYELVKLPLLFLDEIHHKSAQKLREQLLRVIEAKEIEYGGAKVSLDKARFLFAASQPPEKLRGYEPPDFWTRIEYTVVMRHPLLLGTREEINETLRQFFCKFWRVAAEKRREGARDEQIKAIIEYLCPERNDEKMLEGLSELFAESLDSPLIPAISIRHLRGIVNRLFSNAVYFLRTVKLQDAKKLDALKAEMDKWIVQIFTNIVPEIKPEGLF